MRETPKAQRAFNDYVEMGPGRSIDKLFALYENGTKPAPVSRLRTLKDWSVAFNWQARLLAIAEAERQAIVARGIADKQYRMDALNDRHRRFQRIIEERAEDPTMQNVPGGGTGMVLRTYKSIGAGPSAQCFEEYAADTALSAEMRATEKQAAQEMGQWTEGQSEALLKHIDLSKLTDKQLEQLINGVDPIKVLLNP